MLLRNTVRAVLENPLVPPRPVREVERAGFGELRLERERALVLKGVRRCGKSTLQGQLIRRSGSAIYCNFEDTRLFGMGPEDFGTFLAELDEVSEPGAGVFFDEVQEIGEWQRLIRALLDRGRRVCLTGSNASLLGRELGRKLTGRHLSFEVFPFSYGEYLAFTGAERGVESLRSYLDDGGFPGTLDGARDLVLQELLRDIVSRDVAARHRLRETRHVMNLVLFLFAHTGQPFSYQRLTKNLEIPTVAQTSRYVEFLLDAYLLVAVPKFSESFKKRVVTPVKYYAVDNGLRRANSVQSAPDIGRRLENAVALDLRRRSPVLAYAAERDAWECDFVTENLAVQSCLELSEANRKREVRGLVEAMRFRGERRALVVTLDQRDKFAEQGHEIEVVPAWEWLG